MNVDKRTERQAQSGMDGWHELGQRLRAARGGMSKREAARRAGFSEGLWRQLEEGERRVSDDVTLPLNPSDTNLARALIAVGLDPVEAFPTVGRVFDPIVLTEPSDALEPRVGALETEMREVREALEVIQQEIARRS